MHVCLCVKLLVIHWVVELGTCCRPAHAIQLESLESTLVKNANEIRRNILIFYLLGYRSVKYFDKSIRHFSIPININSMYLQSGMCCIAVQATTNALIYCSNDEFMPKLSTKHHCVSINKFSSGKDQCFVQQNAILLNLNQCFMKC